MSRRSSSVAAVAAAGLGIMLAVAAGGGASAASGTAADTGPVLSVAAASETGDPLRTDPASLHEEIAQFAADDGLTFDEAAKRLSWQSAVPLIEAQARALYKDAFTGVWIDTEDGHRIKVGAVAPPALAGRELARFAGGVGVAGVVDVVATKYSEAEVEQALTELRAAAAKSGTSAGIFYNPRDNQIRVQVSEPVAELSRSAGAAVLDTAAQHAGLVSVSVGAVTTQARAGCFVPYCDPPLRAGIRVRFVEGPCTGAFLARGVTDNVLRQISAGHCTFGQGTTNVTTATQTGVTKSIGPVHYADFSTANDSHDIASYNVVNNTYWQSKAWVFVTSSDDTTPNTEYPIFSDANPTLGMRVCTTGQAYGLTDCGEITDTSADANVCVFRASGTQVCRIVTNMMRANFCGIPGDSGAPVYSLNSARGIQISGISICDSFMVKESYLESGLNVNIAHHVP